MTQPSRSNQLTASSAQQPPPESSPESSQVVNAYADTLMDELFEDVDHILAGDPTAEIPANPPPSLATAFPAEPATFGAEGVAGPAMLVPTRQADTVDTAPEPTPSTGATPDQSRWSKARKLLPKLTLAAACFSGLIALGFWLARNQSQPSLPAPPVSTDTTLPTLSEEAAFGEYLQRSLNMIDGQRVAQNSSTAPAGTAPASALPEENNPGTDTRSRTPNVIERVFVPVFQPSQPVATRPMLPTLPAPNPNPANNSQAIAPQSNNSNQAPATAATIPNIAPTSTHMLLGVLELGDRSAALFEVNGVPQRVYVGERIGSSGWSLVSVANQEVTVRRNGEVRSIYIGQQF
jgi:Tfp pilus assembly protein PilP